MEIKIKIKTSDSCKVIVLDCTTFAPEELLTLGKGEFKKSLVVAIDVLELHKTTGSIYKNPVYTILNESNLAEIPVEFDGWFTVNHIIVPSKLWVDSERAKGDGSIINSYGAVYYSDGHSIRKYVNGVDGEATVAELVLMNTVDTTITRTYEDYISICFLRKCYINLCLQIFNGRGFSPCWSKNNIDSELVYKRDLAWMAINVIKYLAECEQLAEVLRIIESLQGCNGLCNPSNLTSTTNGCGCSK